MEDETELYCIRLERLVDVIVFALKLHLLTLSEVCKLSILSKRFREEFSKAGVEVDLIDFSIAGGSTSSRRNVFFWPLRKLQSTLSASPHPIPSGTLSPVVWSIVGLAIRMDGEDDYDYGPLPGVLEDEDDRAIPSVPKWDDLTLTTFQDTKAKQRLQRLWVRHLYWDGLDGIGIHFKWIRELRLLDVNNSCQDLTGLAGCELLESLYLGNCTSLVSTSGLEFTSVRLFKIVEANQLIDVKSLSKCRQLERLSICSADKLQDLSALSDCAALKTLTLVNLVSVTCLGFLSGVVSLSLEELVLGWMLTLESLEEVMYLKNVKTVSLSCLGAFSVAPVFACETLQELELSHLWNLVSLDGIDALHSLQKLTLEKLPPVDRTVLDSLHCSILLLD